MLRSETLMTHPIVQVSSNCVRVFETLGNVAHGPNIWWSRPSV